MTTRLLSFLAKVATKGLSYLRSTRPRYVIAAGLAIALYVGWAAQGTPTAETTVRLVRHASVVYKDRPMVRTSFVDRVIYKTTKPDTVWKSLPGEADTIVRSYCAPDTTKAAERLLLLSGRVEAHRLTLFGATNRGVAYHGTWPVSPTYQFVADADSVQVTSARVQFHLPSLVSHGLVFGIGLATGFLLTR